MKSKTAQPHIFLVDDDQEDRQFFKEALDEIEKKATVETFNNGVDLMANLLDPLVPLPDVVFLDLNMPLMNGEECLADIRGERLLANIPIIIYSTYFDELKVSLLQKKGADRYLQKPKSFVLLKQAISSCLESLSLEKELVTDFIIK